MNRLETVDESYPLIVVTPELTVLTSAWISAVEFAPPIEAFAIARLYPARLPSFRLVTPAVVSSPIVSADASSRLLYASIVKSAAAAAAAAFTAALRREFVSSIIP